MLQHARRYEQLGPAKYLVAEANTYKKFPWFDLYGPFDINYCKSVSVAAVRRLEFHRARYASRRVFVTTGEVLIKDFAVESSGNRRNVVVDLEWTFRLEFVEVVWGDGETANRQVISATDRPRLARTASRFLLTLKEKMGAICRPGLGGQWRIHTAGAFAVGRHGIGR